MPGWVQSALVLVLVAAAALFVLRRAWATLRPKRDAGCASGCGCATGDARDDGDWAKT